MHKKMMLRTPFLKYINSAVRNRKVLIMVYPYINRDLLGNLLTKMMFNVEAIPAKPIN
jgi:hypothetical protein